MEQYGKWPEEYENYPIQNIMVSELPNQNQVKYKRIIYTNNPQQDPQIYPSKGRIIQGRNQYIKYNINNSNQNQNNYIIRNNQINNNYSQTEYFKSPNVEKNKNPNNKYNKFTKYESSDGVLRGYTNNFSFYESGSAQTKQKPNNYASNQYIKSNNVYTNRNIQYNNIQRTNISQDKTRRYQNDINSNLNSNRQIINANQNDNSSYIIRVIEDNPAEYILPNQQQYVNNYTDMNYNNNINNNENAYYNENESRYVVQNYRPPTIQRRMVKRVIHKQPNTSRGNYYTEQPRDNFRNYNNNQNPYRNDIQQVSPNIGYRKIISSNIYQRNDLNSYQPLRRNYTPNTQYSNYSRPVQQKRIIEPNYSENNITSVSYNAKYPYKTFTELNNNYIIPRTQNNSPSNRSPFIGHSPNININKYNRFMFQKQFNPKQREYASRTEQNLRGYEYEYENEVDDDDVYEVPEQFNNNYNNRSREYNEPRRQNIVMERPFTRISNYSQTQRNGKKYGVYTQTLAMNRNYYSHNNAEEYEYEVPNNIRNNRTRENYSQPKIMRPINEVQRLLRNKREYSAFERSLRNIRDNEEEIELENERRNNRVRIKTSGDNNIRFISNNNGRPSREYKTFTQQQDYRTQGQGYILQDIDDSNFEDYDSYQNQSNKNIGISPNVISQRNRMQQQYMQGKNYFEEQQLGNIQNINNLRNIQNYNEQEVDEDDDNDEEEQIYDSNQLITAKEDNFGIVQNINKGNINNREIDDEEVEHAQIQMNEREMEEQRSTENNGIYRREEVPEDRDENILPNGKNLKNIETEINEKYYDNQGNYLGEKKIITTEQVPREEYLQQDDEYYEEQEEIEENENDNEYTPYQSSNKKFKKRGENMVRPIGRKVDGGNIIKTQNIMNINKNNYKDAESKSKYQSYFGDSNNNVYYEIKGVSGEVKEDSKDEEEIGNKSSKEPATLVKNVTFGIESENLCVPADENENETDVNARGSEKQRNTNTNTNNDEKEADEQQVDENAGIEEEEQNQVTLHQNNENNELPVEQSINANDNNGEISENINDNNNESKKIEYIETNQNYSNKEEIISNNKEEQNDDNNYEDSNNHYDENNENINNYEEDNCHDDGNNNNYNENEKDNLYEENNNNYEEDNSHYNENNDKENENINNEESNKLYEENNNNYEEENNHYSEHNENNNYEENLNNNDENINTNENIDNNMNMMNENNGEYNNNMEYENENQEEQYYEENEGEEIENLNIQKDENDEEEYLGEEMVEQNNNYNYQQDPENDYEENDNFDEGREEYNVVEEDKLNKEETIDKE